MPHTIFAMHATRALLAPLAAAVASTWQWQRSAHSEGRQTFRRLRGPREGEKKQLRNRLIKHTDFIYKCLSNGRLEDYYILEKELGFGSFGTIYLAKHKTLDFKFAVKKVPKAGDPKVTELLMNEVHALMDLDHPHVVKLVRYFDEGNHMYLVFELCEGPDLLSRLEREGRFDENEAASTLRQMLAALKCCHDHYMGHFDVKPENFIYRSKDCAKLKMIDLGLASHFKRSRQEIRGTSAYMAPEMWDGFFGPEADVWGCGVVLFCMLTGEQFFPSWLEDDEIKPLARDRKWVRSRLRVLRELDLSKDAIDLLTSMMSHDRHKRPTVREALHHPFFQRYSEKAAAEALRQQNPARYRELDRQTEEVLDHLVDYFIAFASEPVIVRAALLLMAHVGAYSFNATKAQRSAFTKLDRTSSGGLCMEELEAFYDDRKMPIPEVLEDAFSGIDVDDDGYITYIEFLSATLPNKIRCNETFCRRVFELMDRNDDGYIDASDLSQALMAGNDHRGVCRESLAEVSQQEERISWQQFLTLMRSPKVLGCPPVE
ncbi:Calcium-dependent protein kinase 32 [Durusdinium trenchii]|uniref:Calcium-dependent protein kinase 32 n=1 Tax=Durusdinium trenchii TaxID=1381693 RepID=A0ABP0KB17_9DINO